MQFNRIINIKPGSMNKVLEIAPKFPHLAKKILGEKYKGPIKVMVRLHGPLGQIKWQWENDSMDEDVQNAMTFPYIQLEKIIKIIPKAKTNDHLSLFTKFSSFKIRPPMSTEIGIEA